MAASMAGSHACMTLAHLPSLSPPTQTCRRYTQRGLGLSYISHFTPTPTYTPTRTSLVLRLLCRRYTHTGNRGVAFALFYSIMNVAALTQVGFRLGIGLFDATQPQVAAHIVKLFYAIMLLAALTQVRKGTLTHLWMVSAVVCSSTPAWRWRWLVVLSPLPVRPICLLQGVILDALHLGLPRALFLALGDPSPVCLYFSPVQGVIMDALHLGLPHALFLALGNPSPVPVSPLLTRAGCDHGRAAPGAAPRLQHPQPARGLPAQQPHAPLPGFGCVPAEATQLPARAGMHSVLPCHWLSQERALVLLVAGCITSMLGLFLSFTLNEFSAPAPPKRTQSEALDPSVGGCLWGVGPHALEAGRWILPANWTVRAYLASTGPKCGPCFAPLPPTGAQRADRYISGAGTAALPRNASAGRR